MYVREARPCLAVDREVAGVLAAAAPPLGMPSGGEERTSPWLEAIAGIRSNRIPGWAPSLHPTKPVSAPRTADPLRGTVRTSARVFTGSVPRLKHLLFVPSASKCVRGRVCEAFSQKRVRAVSSIGLHYPLDWGNNYLGVLVLGNLGNLVLHSGIFGIVPVHAGQSVHCAGQRRKVCRAYFLWSLVLFGELGFITHNRLRLSLHSSSLVRSTRR